MKTGVYTAAIDNIHVSQSAIEAALAAAKLRAAKTASAQAKLRYAAIAASVVLAGAASTVYFGNIAKFEPPVSPAPAAPTAASTQADDETEAKAANETATATEKPAALAETVHAAEGTENNNEYPIEQTEINPKQGAASSHAEPTAAATEAAAPTISPTDSAPVETSAEQSPIPEVDPSLLCADGKLFIAVTGTGLDHIDDPDAFSDDHLYYIETKFGRYYQIRPLQIEHFDLRLNEEKPQSDEMVYLYNSDGEIVGQAPVWW